MRADARGCELIVPEIDANLAIAGNRDHLLAALANLLQSAIKFTQPNTPVTLHAYAYDELVRIDVKDHCGGLPNSFAKMMFVPFAQGGLDRSGLGLGLSIARKSVEADGDSLSVRLFRVPAASSQLASLDLRLLSVEPPIEPRPERVLAVDAEAPKAKVPASAMPISIFAELYAS